ncbi:Holo-[acyl-carrier-protein] synthase [Candidatus Rhabdochlamydia porcellionis]|jgi:holo-[acyl-carrier protein] synthase|uniref:Holo-[acyl-carrier-protein] synthase n=2 Tax=Candidatus Rhabdochlamydia porcellionis TaxID=225148 RepID=A0ABX8Z1W2_9BACT|nr:Holo-[acyl-carrier-protein] synthase [Candidatus Rhabdochlamydia porcellionis]
MSSHILGLGTDIIEIERIRQSIDNHGYRLISRIFTPKERDYCLKYKDPIPHFAARFSAKEAIVKALGTGFTEHITWQDIEIINGVSGKPLVHFSTKLQKKTKGTCMLLSMSHCRSYATATALWTKN